MKFPFLMMNLGLLLVFLTSCARIQQSGPENSSSERPARTFEKKQLSKVSAPSAVWYLFKETQVTLYLKNLDNGMPATHIIQNGLTQLSLPKGHWQLTGFEENGVSFTSMNTSKKFVFNVRPRSHTYAGSIVIGCPKVGARDINLLKNMRFFNRYPFSSSARICEVIVGNDFAMVRSEFKKLPENKGLTLKLGL